MYFKTSLSGGYTSVPMINSSADTWTADIPAQVVGTHVYYYIEANANSGKSQVRPITAPAGYFHFLVEGSSAGVEDEEIQFGRVFPNPSSGLTCVEIENVLAFKGSMKVYNVIGEEIETVHSGTFPGNSRKYFLDVSDYASGAYQIVLVTDTRVKSAPLMVR